MSLISSKKQTKTRPIEVVKTNPFVCFLEEFMSWQFAFEVIWPLRLDLCLDRYLSLDNIRLHIKLMVKYCLLVSDSGVGWCQSALAATVVSAFSFTKDQIYTWAVKSGYILEDIKSQLISKSLWCHRFHQNTNTMTRSPLNLTKEWYKPNFWIL